MIAPSIICIGGSSGAIESLRVILSNLPRTLRVPLVVVLHRHKDSQDVLMRLLRAEDTPAIVEPFDKEPLSEGAVYLGPPNYHLLVDRDMLCLSVEEPVHHARPSIDALFESAAQAYGRQAICILLSGSSSDGAEGARQIRDAGGHVIVQDPGTALAAELPVAAMKLVPEAIKMPVEEIPRYLVKAFALERSKT